MRVRVFVQCVILSPPVFGTSCQLFWSVEQPVKLKLKGGESLKSPIVAEGYPKDIPAKIKWFRAPAGGQLDDLPVEGNTYQLTVADLGARICAQWTSDDGLYQSNFAQLGPIQFTIAGMFVDAQFSRPSHYEVVTILLFSV